MNANPLHEPSAGSAVERHALRHSPFERQYPPTEKMPVIVVDDFPALGRYAALRFLEWVQANPGGVVSLPTGKTPEFFIRSVRRLLATWERPETVRLLAEVGLDPAVRPAMGGLRFVQMDEFYPMDPRQTNSLCHFVRTYYLAGFGLDPARALLIASERIGLAAGEAAAEVWPGMRVDLSLRTRAPASRAEEVRQRVLAAVDRWCAQYEARIQALGGIGFFLGGIGPDGHVAFNVRGSPHDSRTRLCATNHETQAAAATDLGGIETARWRPALTIGLGTITANPGCVAVIIAAGEAKARVVADAVQNAPDSRYPATALHQLPNACFWATAGAARDLRERRQVALLRGARVEPQDADRVVIDLALKLGRPLARLSRTDFLQDRLAAALLDKTGRPAADLTAAATRRLTDKLIAGTKPRTGCAFLHTEPHPDDLLLGCLPAIARLGQGGGNRHTFATMTSGFTAVTNDFLAGQLRDLKATVSAVQPGAIADGGAADEARTFVRGLREGNSALCRQAAAARLLRNVIRLGRLEGGRAVAEQVDRWLTYLDGTYAGAKDPPDVQALKGACREWETECAWAFLGWDSPDVRHLRLAFYTGDIFTGEPERERDVPPLQELLREIRPAIISVTLDPESSGPDTHYKVLQAVHAAVETYVKEAADLRIWGYRNVWSRFHPAEADLIVPVSGDVLGSMETAFLECFASQRTASFPSHELDGPFSSLALAILREQLPGIRQCLGDEASGSAMAAELREAEGLLFLREMTPAEFFRASRALRRGMEGADAGGELP